MRSFLFLLGAPGAGKTTVTRALLGTPTSTLDRWTVGQKFAAAGPYTGAVLDGPDSLPYSNVLLEKALERGLLLPPHLVAIFDGERFGAWARDALRGRARAVAVFLQGSRASAAALFALWSHGRYPRNPAARVLSVTGSAPAPSKR
jgi:hypothetical protein